MRANVRVVFGLVMACFFVSGVAGLVYQVAWARYLALFLGHTSYAVVAVLVAFMGGLAIGNALLGAVADRAERPLALYGWLEIGIALYALAFPWYYEFCHDLYISAARNLSGGGTPLLLLKFAFSFLTIVLPTALMGATFPVLTKFVTLTLAELREKVASLYFINSVGAVVGCFAADFWWIPSIGLELTMFAAAALNLIAGLIALGMSRAILEGTPTAARESSGKSPDDEYISALDLKIAAIAIGVSGFVAMLYEVAWTRLLALALGSSTHAFSIMLITFISGIAVGAAIIARWKSLRRTMDAFGWAETALAATVFISMFAYEYLPFWFYKLSSTLARTPAAYPLYELAQGVICFIVMFIPAVCLGTTLPLASRIATAELSRTGHSVGRIFAVNTLGTVLGAAVTGLWLMPTFGLASTFAIGFVMNAAIGAAILLRGQFARFGRTAVVVGAFAALVVITMAGAYFDPRWRGSFTQGVWRTRSNFDFQRFLTQRENMEFLYYKDGPGATIALHNYKNDTNYISLRVNGKADASTFDAGTQLLLGHLPALLHTKATNALVVGLGSGMTCGALLRHTNILQTDVVEISREVVEAAPLWGHHNDNVMKNPRLKVTIEDAKSFLKSSDRKFDIIVNEPSNPWMAGVAAVFSKEFYETCSDRLATNGVMAQWVQIYETSDEALRTVVKTFSESFPFISIWRAQAGDIILVGSRQVRGNNVQALLEQMGNPQVQPDLARGGFSEPYAFLTREVMSEQNGAFLARPETAVHSDYYPTLEYVSQVAFFAGANTTMFELYDETRSPRSATHLGALLKQRPPGEEDFKRLARASLDREIPDGRLTLSLMERWAEASTNSTLPVEMIERLGASRPTAVVEEMRLAPRHEWMLEQARTDIAILQFYERVLMRAYRANRTIFHTPNTQKLEQVLGLLLERDPVNRRVYNLHFSELAWDKGDDQACLRFGAIGFNPDVNQSGPLRFTLDELAPRQTLCNMIEASLRMGDLRQARNLAEQAQRGGYLRPGELFFPPLEFICRKVQTIIEAK